NVIGNVTGGGLYLPPIRLYVTPIAPSGATFLHHPGTAWTGQYVLAALRGTELRRLQIRGGRVVSEVEMLRNRYGRLRTVREAPASRSPCSTRASLTRTGRATAARRTSAQTSSRAATTSWTTTRTRSIPTVTARTWHQRSPRAQTTATGLPGSRTARASCRCGCSTPSATGTPSR